jgi:hypothetical protein
MKNMNLSKEKKLTANRERTEKERIDAERIQFQAIITALEEQRNEALSKNAKLMAEVKIVNGLFQQANEQIAALRRQVETLTSENKDDVDEGQAPEA